MMYALIISGTKCLTGCGKYLENLVRSRLQVKVRSVELNVSQRCSTAMLSAADQKEAMEAGAFGVKAAVQGETGKMVSFIRDSEKDEYVLNYGLEDVNEICNKEKPVPVSWIAESGNDMTDDFIQYAMPLIQGVVSLPLDDNGLPLFAYRK